MLYHIPVSLYIHIPWCIKKCLYCDFNSYVSKKIIDENKYIYHLLKDFSINLKFIPDRKIHSIFIGGGSPSLFHPSSINLLIQEIKKRVEVTDNLEITIESNPHTIESKKFLHYKNIGINRISIGIQSFQLKHLKLLGRTYTTKEITKVISLIKSINFKNFNIDLMHNLPYQSLEEALEDVKIAISIKPNHISWYQLNIEKHTAFYYSRPQLPTEKIMLDIFKYGTELLNKAGFHQYEISSYAKIGFECQHNLNYWKFGDYIGIGCGAHGKITTKNGQIIRTVKNKRAFDFFNGNYLQQVYKIKSQDKPLEFFMNRCRLNQPILKQEFYTYTQVEEKTIRTQINEAISEGFLIENSVSWKTTKKGSEFLNSLLEIFVH